MELQVRPRLASTAKVPLSDNDDRVNQKVSGLFLETIQIPAEDQADATVSRLSTSLRSELSRELT